MAFNAVVTAVSLDILGLPSVLRFYNAYLCLQNFQEHLSRQQVAGSDLGFVCSR